MAPAWTLPDELRKQLHEYAIQLTSAAKYKNAGTVEFLIDAEMRPYFIEVNPRIQVEHTVTEEVTGIDLVQAQIRIASGATLEQVGLFKTKLLPEELPFNVVSPQKILSVILHPIQEGCRSIVTLRAVVFAWMELVTLA